MQQCELNNCSHAQTGGKEMGGRGWRASGTLLGVSRSVSKNNTASNVAHTPITTPTMSSSNIALTGYTNRFILKQSVSLDTL
jgi:hypothetical protein